MKSKVTGAAVIGALAALSLALAAGGAEAHAKLVGATPTADSNVGSPDHIQLHFSEALEPKLSGANLMKLDGANVPMASMVNAKDRKVIDATPAGKLAPGGYMVMWHAVSTDGHSTAGSYNFNCPLSPTILALAVPVARLAEFAGATVLFGAPLFAIYSRAPASPDTRRMAQAAAWLTLIGALVQLSAQTASMTGADADAFHPAALWLVLSSTRFGHGLFARIMLAAVAALAAMAVQAARNRLARIAQAALGGAIVASFAWTGHGSTDEGLAGAVHLLADAAHLLAAAVWIGALAELCLAVFRVRSDQAFRALHAALAGFSGVGTAAVAVLILTGLVNGWFLVGPAHVADLAATPYGKLLLVKLGLFVLMLAAAAANRFILTPRLGGGLGGAEASLAAVRALRTSILVETALAIGVLAAVAWLGQLEPPVAA